MDETGAIWKVLHSGSPLVAVICGNLEDSLDEVISLGDPRWNARRVANVVDALAASLDELVMLSPCDEVAAVEELDGCHERFLDRTVPLVLLLQHGGAGDHALGRCISLMGWLRGNIVDPDDMPPFDATAERIEFFAATGQTPESWLKDHRSGRQTDTALIWRALLLESSS